MKRIEKIISSVLVLSFVMSISGCGKKIDPIDNDDVIEALEDVLDMEKYEGNGDFPSRYYVVSEDYEVTLKDYDNYSAVIDTLDVEYQIMTHTSIDDTSIEVKYFIFEDSDDAEAYFDNLYIGAGGNIDKKGLTQHKNIGNGYFIQRSDSTNGVCYYSDDTLLFAYARTSDDFEEIEEFVDALGLPIQ